MMQQFFFGDIYNSELLFCLLICIFVGLMIQSIIPGILQGDKSESLLYGSVDNGKKIFWNDKFHAKVFL